MRRRSTAHLSRAVAILATALLFGSTAQPATADEPTGSSISGTVTGLSGTLRQPVIVWAEQDFSYNANWIDYVDPDTGRYTIEGLPVGDYAVKFQTVPGGGHPDDIPYVEQYWDGAYYQWDATIISITADGQHVDGIDAEMYTRGIAVADATIRGSGKPAFGVTLTLYRHNLDGGWVWVGSAPYQYFDYEEYDLDPGEYTYFVDASTRTELPALQSAYLGGASSIDDAETFTVALDATTRTHIIVDPVPTDPVALLPCLDRYDRAALRGLVAQYRAAGGSLSTLTRADVQRYIARCT